MAKKSKKNAKDEDFELIENHDEDNDDDDDDQPLVMPKRKDRSVALIAGKTAAELALQFGNKLEYLADEMAKDESIRNDQSLLNALVEHFDVKLLTGRKLTDSAKWETKVIEKSGKFACKQCGKTYGTRLGCKYHVNGKCPKDPAMYSCRLCGEESSDQQSTIVHIKQTHLGLKDVKRPTRGPASGPNCWIISEALLIRAAQMKQPEIKLDEKSSFKPKPYKIERPQRKAIGPGFNGTVGEKAIGAKKENKFNVPFGESHETCQNEQFTLNAGARVTDACWLRLGNHDAIAVATTADFYSTNVTDEDSSSLQLWRFNESLIDDVVNKPRLAMAVNVPFVINAITQFNTADRAFAAVGCSDGLVRLCELMMGEKTLEIKLDCVLLKMG